MQYIKISALIQVYVSCIRIFIMEVLTLQQKSIRMFNKFLHFYTFSFLSAKYNFQKLLEIVSRALNILFRFLMFQSISVFFSIFQKNIDYFLWFKNLIRCVQCIFFKKDKTTMKTTSNRYSEVMQIVLRVKTWRLHSSPPCRS